MISVHQAWSVFSVEICMFRLKIHIVKGNSFPKYVFYCIRWKAQDFQSLHSNGRKSEEKMKWLLNNKTKVIGYLLYWIEG